MNGTSVLLLLFWFASFIFLVKNDTPVSLKGHISLNNRILLPIIDVNATFVEAIRGCNKIGMNLAGIESLTEWEDLVDMLLEMGFNTTEINNGNIFWTSGNNWNKPRSTEFSWLTTGNPVEKVLFAEGQPNGQDCVIIVAWDQPDHLGYNGFALNDAVCNTTSIGYFCEARDNCIN